MATEYRICTKADHPGYVFVETSPWGIPGLWVSIFAEMITAKGMDAAFTIAEQRAIEYATAKRTGSVTKYLGRLP